MGLRIYNTLTRKKEDFDPIVPGKVGMYVCGMTVYDMCHIGHARSMVVFDVVYRYLNHREYDVNYVRNFTDVDDKIINRAAERGTDWKSLAEEFIGEFYRDMDALGIRRPDREPKATEHIAEMQSLIERLIENGLAYETGGDVMYSVNNFLGYGKLSGRKLEDLISGARVEVDEKKDSPLDFALWKASKPGEPWWESPWGKGRPGWHIECSAMSGKHLGESFDIHGGGADLVFPHHENEIAQSEGATGKPYVKYWIHNGFVNVDSVKMSKSLGNMLNIRDILDERKVHPEALRIFLLTSHYRSPLDYNETAIRDASSGLERLYSAMSVLDDLIALQGELIELPEELKDISDRFNQAMDDDFNTPRAMAILFEAARAVNRISSAGTAAPGKVPTTELLTAVREEMRIASQEVLGILKEDPATFLGARRLTRASDVGLDEPAIEAMIADRAEARKQKDFSRADQIRDELASKGILLKDGPEGTSWTAKE
jgi:cysteinyl-tRNA synthetase